MADFDIIIGHGGGSFPHVVASRYKVNEGLKDDKSKEGALLTAMSAKELNTIILKASLEEGMPAFPFSPSSFALASNSVIMEGFVEGIKVAVEKGFMPVVYGDVGIDAQKGVCILSTEEVFSFIASAYKPSKVFFGTDVNGVYDSDPKENPNASLINIIDSSNISMVMPGTNSAAKRADVTGGMATKLSKLYEIAKATGAECYIFNATRPEELRNMLSGRSELANCTVVKK